MKLGCSGKDLYDDAIVEMKREHLDETLKEMKKEQQEEEKNVLKEMYGSVNNRSVELSIRPLGPIKSVAARRPYNNMRKEHEKEENEMKDKERYINDYSDFELVRPDCHPGELAYGAKFKLNRDITELFPYINAVGEAPKYRKNPYSIVFYIDGLKCAFYADYQAVASFDGEASARKFIKRLIDYLNDIYERRDSIIPNHKVYKSVPALSIFKFLPRTNCKECGYASCMAFAAAVSKSEVSLDLCPSQPRASVSSNE